MCLSGKSLHRSPRRERRSLRWSQHPVVASWVFYTAGFAESGPSRVVRGVGRGPFKPLVSCARRSAVFPEFWALLVGTLLGAISPVSGPVFPARRGRGPGSSWVSGSLQRRSRCCSRPADIRAATRPRPPLSEQGHYWDRKGCSRGSARPSGVLPGHTGLPAHPTHKVPPSVLCSHAHRRELQRAEPSN